MLERATVVDIIYTSFDLFCTTLSLLLGEKVVTKTIATCLTKTMRCEQETEN